MPGGNQEEVQDSTPFIASHGLTFLQSFKYFFEIFFYIVSLSISRKNTFGAEKIFMQFRNNRL